jgi:polygalacturonase
MKKFLVIGFLGLFANMVFARNFVLTDYGVGTDSTTLCTQAVQHVIDLAAQKGGTVVVPKGVFLTGALFFKPGTRLRLMEGAVLKGSDNIADYPLLPSRMEGKVLDYYAALINAYGVDGFSITGPGMINGNATRFWTQFWAYRDSLKQLGQYATNLDVHRPRLVFIRDSRNIRIQNVTLCNSGYWTTHLYRCRDIVIEHCRITSPKKPVPAPSTDGIDLDVCSNVRIRSCFISVNDDAVCIKGGKGPLARTMPENGLVENVRIEQCTIAYPSPSILTFGSECIHGRNIRIRNCRVDGTRELVLFKMRPDTYQTYENVVVEGVTGTSGSIVNMSPWMQFFNLEGTKEKPYGIVRNIRFNRIRVQCPQFGSMKGNPTDSVSTIVFRNMTLEGPESGVKSPYDAFRYENVRLNGRLFSH